MKITVIIPSRGRVRRLAAALTNLDHLASRKHDITYAVCCDEDDPNTKLFCFGIQKDIKIAVREGPRPSSMGEMINDMALRVPGDVYCSYCDDFMCITPGWDDIIAQEVEKLPHGVFWWKDALPPSFITLAIVTEKWRQAAGRLYTDHYPFWYDDLCLMELWTLATDTIPILIDVFLVDRPVQTQRMRELPFWQKVFNATRVMRVKEGADIAAKLGLPEPRAGQKLADYISIGLEAMPEEYLKEIENNQGEGKVPPDPAYLRAKERAENLLKELSMQALLS